MAAPFSTKSHTTAEIEKISNEIKETIKNTQWDGNDVLKIELRIDVCGHGVRPFGDYANGAYRDFSISIGRKEWNGLTKADLMAIGKSIKNIDGFEVESKDIYVEYGKMMPDFSYPTYYRKYGNACDEWGELCKLVSKKYGIKLNVKDLYLVRMSGTIKDQEVGERTYIAYAPYRCNQLIDKIKSFGRKRTTCEIVTIDDFEWMDNERAVTLEIKPNHK